MRLPELKITRTGLFILVVLFILTFSALWIRVLPLLTLNTDILNIVAMDDPMFNLRQTEQMLAHFPQYAWFEAMTLFPTGQAIPWGPLFIWLSSVMCIIAGASTRSEIIGVALWLPPILGALMVPAMFVLVRKAWDWKAGILAAGLIAVIGGQFFFRSLAGYLDHHIAEVFFSTVFCIAYIYAIVYMREHPVDFSVKETLKMPVLLSAVAGITYILGFLTMSTMILFAFIVALSTAALFIVDFYHGKRAGYLLVLNGVTFGIAAIISLLLGFLSGGISGDFGFYLYSLAHPISYIFIIIGTAVLYWLSQYLKGKDTPVYAGSVIGLGLLTLLGLALLLPGLFGSFIGNLQVFFGLNPFAVTVQEARPWTLIEAWTVFSFGIILMIAGALVLLYKSWKEYRPEHIFVLVWSLFIIIAAFRQVRYEYYLAVNVALLGGISLGFFLDRAWPDIRAMGRRVAVQEQKAEPEPQATEKKGSAKKKKEEKAQQKAEKGKQKAPSRPTVNYVNILIAGLLCACALIFAVTSLQVNYAVASSGGIRMNQDWREALEWMETGTPDTGVDYFTIYDRDTFTYPDTAYGVMSWWDYGHMITYIAKRIPNANPFQAGVSGRDGAAAFFISQTEEETNRIADVKGTRYVMTDIEMATGKFWAMATWYNSTEGQQPYQPVFLVPDNPANPRALNPVTTYTDKYYLTTIARLHTFDGSFTPTGDVYYIEYTTTSGAGPYPVITSAAVMGAAEARAAADRYNAQAQPGSFATIVNSLFNQPTVDVPALSHYRLVHESPTNIFSGATPDVRYVKVFEYVPGARIQGEGVIEVPVTTNTGRQFVWRAASVDGEFIVPYATEGSPYEVRATGNYRIVGTGREYSVPEDAVISGAPIA